MITTAPYGVERAYSALRFALTSILEGIDINIFLIEDGVYVGKKNQNPAGVPNYLEYLKNCIESGATVKVCGPCCSARGLNEEDLIEGVKLATMHDLVEFAKESDKVITF